MQTVMGTAQAAGVAMLVAARHGIPVSLHTPSEVKARSPLRPRPGRWALVTNPQARGTAETARRDGCLALAICHVVASRPERGGGGCRSEGRAAAECLR
jgi:crossover junction endodeoxyribonuclease RuvC